MSAGGAEIIQTKSYLQISVVRSWIQKEAYPLDGEHLMHSHVRCDLSRARPRTHVAFGCACTRTAERHWRQIGVSVAFAGSCPSAYKWGVLPGQRTHTHASTQAETTLPERPSPNQPRCLTPRSPCASWDSSPSHPPVTSRTAPVEGNERSPRPGSDRWGRLRVSASFFGVFFLDFSFIVVDILNWKCVFVAFKSPGQIRKVHSINWRKLYVCNRNWFRISFDKRVWMRVHMRETLEWTIIKVNHKSNIEGKQKTFKLCTNVLF